jgi:hypothetical protein
MYTKRDHLYMNKMTILELLGFIQESISLIKRRSSGIKAADDFLFNDENLDKFEASVMRLQTVGEALKSIEKKILIFLYRWLHEITGVKLSECEI